MKTPRVTDFDPDAKAPSLKSSLDKMPVIEKPSVNRGPTPSPATPAVRLEPAKPKTPPSTTRSFIKRTFDLYEDQLNYLTKESLQDRLAGKEGSMNSMVREALDEWIAKRKKGQQS
jgi:hypothetical protein